MNWNDTEIRVKIARKQGSNARATTPAQVRQNLSRDVQAYLRNGGQITSLSTSGAVLSTRARL